MMYYQNSLLTIDDYYEWKPLSKLESILSFVDFSLIEQEFQIPSTRRGPKGYSKRQLLCALIAMKTLQLPSMKALTVQLAIDPILKRSCGFSYTENTPSQATLNRFINQLSKTSILERTYRRMIHKAVELDLIDDSCVAIDASKLDSYEHAIPKARIPQTDKEFPNWGGKLDTNGNFIKWFGWKMHALVDTTSGIPISYVITPANIADVDVAHPLIQKMMNDYQSCFQPKYYLMDAGYDSPQLYLDIHEKYKAQAIIPLNWRNTKIPPEGINQNGQLVCSMNYPYVYGGNDHGVIRLLCPHVCGKCNCPMGSNWCTQAKSGYVGKVKIEDNPRFVTAPFRGTKAFDLLYNQRTSVERTFGELKENYALDRIRVSKMKRAKVFVDLSCICLLANRMVLQQQQSKQVA